MFLSMFAAKILALAAGAAATAISTNAASSSSAEYGWYNFLVSGDEVDDGTVSIPEFAVHCQGFADGWPLSSNLTACDSETALTDASVSARVLPSSDTQAHIAVYYIFSTDGETTRNFTTTIVQDWARERPPHNFTTTPIEADYLG
ncbi:hypothetical protein F5Y13DRAFT_186260 [Hypoxylon sp. FL1857]|nr:hypothetical protein F5Y13DRAFT_186260 [Hypoxylon sp. FL1857]